MTCSYTELNTEIALRRRGGRSQHFPCDLVVTSYVKLKLLNALSTSYIRHVSVRDFRLLGGNRIHPRGDDNGMVKLRIVLVAS